MKMKECTHYLWLDVGVRSSNQRFLGGERQSWAGDRRKVLLLPTLFALYISPPNPISGYDITTIPP